MTRAPFRPRIERAGQPYVDELVCVKPVPCPLARAVEAVYCASGFPRSAIELPDPRPLSPAPLLPRVIGYNRVPLIWKNMKEA
jgi:hypothetical protein